MGGGKAEGKFVEFISFEGSSFRLLDNFFGKDLFILSNYFPIKRKACAFAVLISPDKSYDDLFSIRLRIAYERETDWKTMLSRGIKTPQVIVLQHFIHVLITTDKHVFQRKTYLEQQL